MSFSYVLLLILDYYSPFICIFDDDLLILQEASEGNLFRSGEVGSGLKVGTNGSEVSLHHTKNNFNEITFVGTKVKCGLGAEVFVNRGRG